MWVCESTKLFIPRLRESRKACDFGTACKGSKHGYPDSHRKCKDAISAVSNGTNKIMFIILFTAFNYRGRWVVR